jgi:hypothetical protein
MDDLGRSRAGGIWAGDAVGHRMLLWWVGCCPAPSGATACHPPRLLGRSTELSKSPPNEACCQGRSVGRLDGARARPAGSLARDQATRQAISRRRFRRGVLQPGAASMAAASAAGMCSETAVGRRRAEATAIEETTNERFRSSTPVKWAWLDLNQRPHPYQLNAGNRCADRPFRRSRSTVRVKGMRSIGVQVCVLPWRRDPVGHRRFLA